MAEKVLTDDEMGALMDGVASGDVAVQTGAGIVHGTVEPFDIGPNQRVLSGAHPGLHRLNDALARYVQNWLRGEMNWQVGCDLKAQTVARLSQLNEQLLGLNLYVRFGLAPLDGPAGLILDDRTLRACLERFFGATTITRGGPPAERFSAGERRIGDRLSAVIMDGLAEAWETTLAVSPAPIDSTEAVDRFVLGDGRERAIVSEFQLEADDFDATFRLILPLATLGTLADKLEGTECSADAERNRRWHQQWIGHLLETRVPVVARTRAISLPLGRVRELDTGAVLPIAEPSQLQLVSGGIGLVDGDFGNVDGRVCLRSHGWRRSAH
ncbi:MAG: FliM/FliN family flagellar motor switch protein [Pseudomonadota bacterium]